MKIELKPASPQELVYWQHPTDVLFQLKTPAGQVLNYGSVAAMSDAFPGYHLRQVEAPRQCLFVQAASPTPAQSYLSDETVRYTPLPAGSELPRLRALLARWPKDAPCPAEQARDALLWLDNEVAQGRSRDASGVLPCPDEIARVLEYLADKLLRQMPHYHILEPRRRHMITGLDPVRYLENDSFEADLSVAIVAVQITHLVFSRPVKVHRIQIGETVYALDANVFSPQKDLSKPLEARHSTEMQIQMGEVFAPQHTRIQVFGWDEERQHPTRLMVCAYGWVAVPY